MGVFQEVFGVSKEAEEDIKDIIKIVAIVTVAIAGCVGAAKFDSLPYDEKKEDD